MEWCWLFVCVVLPAAHVLPCRAHSSTLPCRLQVDRVLDTNGAGDTFGTAYMIAAAAGHPDPIAAAHQAAGLAVTQPQACKPACVATALQAGWSARPARTAWEPLQRLLAVPPARQVAQLLGLATRGPGSRAA